MDLKTLLSQYRERTRFYASEVARELTKRPHALLVTTLRSLAVQPAPCAPRGLLPHVQPPRGPATPLKILEGRLRALAQYGLIRCIARQGRQPVYALTDWGRLVLQWLPTDRRNNDDRTVNNDEMTSPAVPTDRLNNDDRTVNHHDMTVPARPTDRLNNDDRIVNNDDMTVPALPTDQLNNDDRIVNHDDRTVNHDDRTVPARPIDRRIDHEMIVNHHEMTVPALPTDQLNNDDRIVNELPAGPGTRPHRPRRQYDWTIIEPQLAALEAQGFTLAESARRLGIAPNTVAQHQYKQRKRQENEAP